MQVPPTESTAFFSNDPGGLARAMIFFGGTAILIIGAVWKFMKGGLSSTMDGIKKDLTKDVDGVGERVGKVEARVGEVETRTAMIESHKAADEEAMRNMHLALGEVKGTLEAIRTRSEETNLELIHQINDLGKITAESASRTREAVGKLEGKVEAFSGFTESLVKNFAASVKRDG